jgi:hypothetical protein
MELFIRAGTGWPVLGLPSHLGWWPNSMEIGELRAVHPRASGDDGGGGFRQAGTGDGWGKGVVVGRRCGGLI